MVGVQARCTRAMAKANRRRAEKESPSAFSGKV
jgi:hypothetical protein